MEADKYLSPRLEVIGIIIESVILDGSNPGGGQGTIPDNPNVEDNG